MCRSMAPDSPKFSTPTSTPTELTPNSDAEGSDRLQDISASRIDGKVKLRRSYENDGNSLSSADDSDNGNDFDEQIQRLRRVSTQSKNYTDEEEKRVIRKFDRRLVLFLALLYMLSFLDRSNIGNARIAGLETTLSLSSSQFEWLLTAFYITYVSFEWMILLYKLIPAHIYISICVFSWGLIACLQSVSTSFVQLLFLRGCLGVTEAAFGPGIPYYMSFFYKRSELAYRVGLQISAAPLAISFAATLAYVIVKLTENGPIDQWRALFLAEGFPSLLVAVIAYHIIPDSPATARYLNQRERKVAQLRLQDEQSTVHFPTSSRGLDFSEIRSTLADPKAYLTGLMFLSVNAPFASTPVFLPTIISDMAFTPLASQALSAPPFLCAFAFVLLIGHLSDKHPDSRAWYIIAVSLLSSASYGAIALAGLLHESIGDAGTVTIRYIGVFGSCMGFFSAVTLIITWTLNNQRSATGKGTGMAILNILGQCGPFIGVRSFPKTQAPYYVPGMFVCSGFMLGVAVLAFLLRWHLDRLNRRNDDVFEYEMVGVGNDEGEISEGLTGLGLGGGDGRGNERFRFML
jgi:Major Facilitator Superfamily